MDENFFKANGYIKRYKTEGIDGMNSRLFIEWLMGLVTPLHKIFSMSLDQIAMLLEWKMANVTTISKNDSKKDRSNYRPLSLTCNLFVISIVKVIIYDYSIVMRMGLLSINVNRAL